jgi:hypothetical protein
MSKSYWPNVASQFLTRPSASGAAHLGRTTPGRSKNAWARAAIVGSSSTSSRSIQGPRRYLWRAVDQDGDLIEILVQKRKDIQAAKRFFRKMLRSQTQAPIEITTDKLRRYAAAKHQLMPSVPHCQDGKTWSTRCTTISTMRRALHDGQKPRHCGFDRSVSGGNPCSIRTSHGSSAGRPTDAIVAAQSPWIVIESDDEELPPAKRFL